MWVPPHNIISGNILADEEAQRYTEWIFGPVILLKSSKSFKTTLAEIICRINSLCDSNYKSI